MPLPIGSMVSFSFSRQAFLAVWMLGLRLERAARFSECSAQCVEWCR